MGVTCTFRAELRAIMSVLHMKFPFRDCQRSVLDLGILHNPHFLSSSHNRCTISSMILTYHTGGCIRASAGDTTLVFGPVSKSSKNFKPTNFGADVAFVPIMSNPDMNGVEEAGRGEKRPFVIFGPGEYEVSGVAAHGFATASTYSGKEHINSVFHVDFDGLSVLYMGALGSMDLPADLLELDSPDVLIIPVGGNGALSPADAQKLAVKLEAKVVIPILFDNKTLTQFLKEAGSEKTEAEDKLTIKLKDIADKQNEVVVLESRS